MRIQCDIRAIAVHLDFLKIHIRYSLGSKESASTLCFARLSGRVEKDRRATELRVASAPNRHRRARAADRPRAAGLRRLCGRRQGPIGGGWTRHPIGFRVRMRPATSGTHGHSAGPPAAAAAAVAAARFPAERRGRARWCSGPLLPERSVRVTVALTARPGRAGDGRRAGWGRVAVGVGWGRAAGSGRAAPAGAAGRGPPGPIILSSTFLGLCTIRINYRKTKCALAASLSGRSGFASRISQRASAPKAPKDRRRGREPANRNPRACGVNWNPKAFGFQWTIVQGRTALSTPSTGLRTKLSILSQACPSPLAGSTRDPARLGGVGRLPGDQPWGPGGAGRRAWAGSGRERPDAAPRRFGAGAGAPVPGPQCGPVTSQCGGGR